MLLGDHLQAGSLGGEVVRRLHQQAAADPLEFQLVEVAAQRHHQHAQVGLTRQGSLGFGSKGRSDQHFDEVLALVHGIDHVDAHFAVESDDAAEGGSGVGLEGLFVGAQQAAVDGHAARVGMLDDDAGGGVEDLDAFPGGIGVGDVVVRQFLALQLGVIGDAARQGDGVAVEGGGLVRVFTVTQDFAAVEGQLQLGREDGRDRRGGFRLLNGKTSGAVVKAGQPVGNHAVVAGGVRECLLGQVETGGQLQRATVGLHFGEQRGVVFRIGDDGHASVVLGRRTDHRRTADVDVLDRIFQRHAGLGDGGGERVEIHADQVDGRDAVFFDGRQVFRQVATGEDAAVHLRVQGLDAAVEHFREAGVVADFGDGEAGVTQHLGGAAGRQQLDTLGGQALGEFEYTRLVGDGNQRLLDSHGGLEITEVDVR